MASLINHFRQLPQRVAQLFVGGMKEPFGTLNLKVAVRQMEGIMITFPFTHKINSMHRSLGTEK